MCKCAATESRIKFIARSLYGLVIQPWGIYFGKELVAEDSSAHKYGRINMCLRHAFDITLI